MPTSTAVILDGTTDGSGVIQDTGFSFASTQPVTGRARKTTSSPYYRTARISGAITGNGLNFTALLAPDE